MQATYEVDDQDLKPVLATLEIESRKCLNCIALQIKIFVIK